MGQSLARHYKRLQAIERARGSLAKDIADRLLRKLRRSAREFPALKAWLNTIPDDPANLVAFLDDAEELRIALEPDAVMRLRFAEQFKLTSKTALWSAKDGEGLLCWRTAGSMLFRNGGTVHAWSRFRSLTGAGTAKHLPSSRNRHASKFDVGVDIHALERAVIAEGRGYVNGARQIMMFGEFTANVGTAVSGSAKTPTAIVQVHLDLRNRPKCMRRTSSGGAVHRACGKFVEVHGYPISEAELVAGFPASAAQVLRHRIQRP